MTIPSERYRAMTQLPEALVRLAYGKGRITKTEIRRLVRRILRHYPSVLDMDQMADKCPNLLER